MKRITLSVSALLFIALLPLNATAASFHFFGGLGPTSWDTSGSTVDYDNSVAYQVGVGWIFRDRYILETSFIDYGLGTYDSRAGLGSTYIDAEVSALAVKFGLKQQLSKRISVNGRVGMEAWTFNTSRTDSGGASIIRSSASTTGTSLSWSLGTEISFARSSAWRFDYVLLGISDQGFANHDLSSLMFNYSKHFK